MNVDLQSPGLMFISLVAKCTSYEHSSLAHYAMADILKLIILPNCYTKSQFHNACGLGLQITINIVKAIRRIYDELNITLYRLNIRQNFKLCFLKQPQASWTYCEVMDRFNRLLDRPITTRCPAKLHVR